MEDPGASSHGTDGTVPVTPRAPGPSQAHPVPAQVATTAAVPTEPVPAENVWTEAEPAVQGHGRGRLVTVLVAAGATVLLVLGLGAFVAYRMLVADGQHPEQFTPASAVAFVAIDLDLSLDQRATLATLAGKVTGAKLGSVSQPGDVTAALLDQLHLTGVDVKRDLTSWLGRQVAISLWLDPKSRPYVLVAATSIDDTKAAEGLDRVRKTLRDADLGFVVHDGHALVAIGEQDAQQAAAAAAAEAQTAALEKVATFREARNSLDDEQLVIAWLDLERYPAALSAALDASLTSGLDEGPFGGVLTGGLVGGFGGGTVGSTPGPSVSPQSHQGVAILGVALTEDGIEARYRTFHAQRKASELTDALAQLSDLPADTQLGAVLAMPDAEWASSTTSPYTMLLGLLLNSTSPPIGPSIMDPMVDATPPSGAELQEIEALLSKDPAELTEADSKRLHELIGVDLTDLTPPGGPDPVLGEDLSDPFAAFAGAKLTLAMTKLDDPGTLRLRAQTTSADAAASIAQFPPFSPGSVTVDRQGTTVTLTSKDYAPGGGKLANENAFQKATAGAPGQTEIAVYLDLSTALTAAQRQRLPIKSVGLVQGTEGGEEVGLVRVLIG